MACKLYYKYGPCTFQLGTFRNRKKAEEFWYFIREALMDKLGSGLEPIYVEKYIQTPGIKGGSTMAVKGAKTIAQFKVLEWVDKNFEPGSVKVVFDHTDRATLIDGEGGVLKAEYVPGEGVKWEPSITAERRENLLREWDRSSEMDDDEYRDWYEELTSDEQALIDTWDKQYAKGVLRLCEKILDNEGKRTAPPQNNLAQLVNEQKQRMAAQEVIIPVHIERELEL